MVALLVHLTSNAIEASLVRFKKESGKQKVYSAAPYIFFGESLPLHGDLKAYLQRAHGELASTKEKIDQVMCVLGSSFSTSTTRTVSHTVDRPLIIDQNLLNKLASGEQRGHEIEREIFSVRANGYETSKPLGKEAILVELTVFQSATSPEILEEIREYVLPTSKKIAFHTFPYVVFKTFSALRDRKAPYIMVEIEKGVTTLSHIKKDSFLESISFDKGADFILGAIKDDLNIDDKVAYSLISMRNEKTLDGQVSKKLEASIQSASDAWNGDALKAFADLSHGVSLPSEVFLVAPKAWNDIFKNVFAKNTYSDFTYEAKDIDLNIADFRDIAQYAVNDTKSENPLLLSLDALYLQNFLM